MISSNFITKKNLSEIHFLVFSKLTKALMVCPQIKEAEVVLQIRKIYTTILQNQLRRTLFLMKLLAYSL